MMAAAAQLRVFGCSMRNMLGGKRASAAGKLICKANGVMTKF